MKIGGERSGIIAKHWGCNVQLGYDNKTAYQYYLVLNNVHQKDLPKAFTSKQHKVYDE